MIAWLAGVWLGLLSSQAGSLSGTLPSILSVPSRVVWVTSDQLTAITCAIDSGTGWVCPDVHIESHGIVVAVGDDAVAYRAIGVGDPRMNVRRRGRLVAVVAGAVGPEHLHELRGSVWIPERSTIRRQATRLVPIKDGSSDVVPLSESTFWVATDSTDNDAFLLIESPEIASTRIALSAAMDGPPELPLFVPAAMPASVDGRVEGAHGDVIEQADVELFAPLAARSDHPPTGFESQVMFRVAATRSDQNGAFRFDRLGSGPFLLTATDLTRGRGVAIVKTMGAPLVVRLAPPGRATGRVLRHHLPVVGARARFVPSSEALIAIADARDLLSVEQITGPDGRFSLSLPPVRSGAVQIIAADGTSVRVTPTRLAPNGEMALGDVTLPDPRRLTIRAADSRMCELSAVGPLGSVGLTIVRASSAGDIHIVDIPEPGQWALNATCAGTDYAVEPPLIVVSVDGSDPIVDVRVVK